MKGLISTVLAAIIISAGSPAWAAGPPAQKEAAKILPTTQLRQGRPANGFRLAYSANDAVCHTVLDALNEPGYDKRYFNTSDKFTNSLPELLIQTRLNVPRMLIGTHLYRTEEYALITGNGRKKYWYRFIGQGEAVLGTIRSPNRPWFGIHTREYDDFMDFFDDALKGRLDRMDYYVPAASIEKQMATLKGNTKDRFYPYEFARFGWLNIPEIILIGGVYYTVTIANFVPDKDKIYIIVAEFINPDDGSALDRGKGICYIESTYIVKITEDES